MLILTSIVMLIFGWITAVIGGHGAALDRERQKTGVVFMFAGLVLALCSLVVAWYA